MIQESNIELVLMYFFSKTPSFGSIFKCLTQFFSQYQMKKLLFLLSLIALCQTLTTTVNGVTYTVYKCEVFAIKVGKTYTYAGTVEVCNDDVNLYINVQLASPYTFVGSQSVKINFGIGLDTSSRPIAGQFPIKSGSLIGQTYWGGFYPLSFRSTTCNSLITMFVHVDVSAGGSEETGFAGATCPTTSSSWFCFITYQATCIPPVPVDVSCAVDPSQDKCLRCQTAFGFGSKTFLQQFGQKRWGWITALPEGGSFVGNIYGGAGLSDVSKAMLVGSVGYLYSNGYAYVTVNIKPNCQVKAYHVYIGSTLPTDFRANGRFPYTGGSIPSGNAVIIPSSGAYLGSATQAYFIAHFDVCCRVTN